MESSWRDETLRVGHPTTPDHEFTLTRLELQLLQHLRQLGEGIHYVTLAKRGRGMTGLSTYKIQEGLPLPDPRSLLTDDPDRE